MVVFVGVVVCGNNIFEGDFISVVLSGVILLLGSNNFGVVNFRIGWLVAGPFVGVGFGGLPGPLFATPDAGFTFAILINLTLCNLGFNIFVSFFLWRICWRGRIPFISLVLVVLVLVVCRFFL